MCRFLLVNSKDPINPEELLVKFAEMAEKSRAYDGDKQDDGWGISWVDGKRKWQIKKSLSPIWEEKSEMGKFPKTKIFVVHARSSSFPGDKGVIDYNQPYVDGEFSFVFNGLLKGVNLPNIPGKIGAEKIWHILKKELKKNTDPQIALEKTQKLLLENSKGVIALNIGLASCRQFTIYSSCYHTRYPEYYQLQSFKNHSLEAVCSEELNFE